MATAVRRARSRRGGSGLVSGISAAFQGTNVTGSRYDIPDVKWVLAFMGDYTIHGVYWRGNSCWIRYSFRGKVVREPLELPESKDLAGVTGAELLKAVTKIEIAAATYGRVETGHGLTRSADPAIMLLAKVVDSSCPELVESR